MAGLDLAAIGNCTLAALVDQQARIVWSCFPQFDGDPVFCRLLTGVEGPTREDQTDWGLFAVELVNQTRCEQTYLTNTAILSSRLSDDAGNAIEVLDFAPRFPRCERMFRPPMLVRRVTPRSGNP